MTNITPLPESEAIDKTAQTYSRIKELLESDTVPEPFLVYGRVQPFLQDFYMNFKKFVHSDGKLDARQKCILGLAVSGHYANGWWIRFFSNRLTELGGSADQVPEIIAVASTNAMYNAFFKFRDISGSDVFNGMSVGLRAHTFGSTSLDDSMVELINIVISDLNGCKPCTSGHVSRARDLGLSDEAILEAVQCGATMAAGLQFLKAAGA